MRCGGGFYTNWCIYAPPTARDSSARSMLVSFMSSPVMRISVLLACKETRGCHCWRGGLMSYCSCWLGETVPTLHPLCLKLTFVCIWCFCLLKTALKQSVTCCQTAGRFRAIRVFSGFVYFFIEMFRCRNYRFCTFLHQSFCKFKTPV